MAVPPSVNVARLLYLLVCEGAGVAIALSTRGSALEVPVWVGVLGGLLVAGFFILVESLMKGFSLRGFSTATFGLLVGLLCAWLLTRVGISQLVAVSMSEQAADAVTLAVEVGLFASLGFLGAVLALRSSRNDFAFIIPYVRFRQDAVTGQPVVLDPETIADGRVAAIVRSGFLAGRLIVPNFVLDELQTLAVSPVPAARHRAEHALAQLGKMQADPDLEVTVHDSSGVSEGDPLEGRLLQTTILLGARLMTTDERLAKVARLRGIEVLNLHELGEALRPEVVVGGTLRIALVRGGKDEDQAVGFLPDGAMIVVNHAAAHIGSSRDVRVISTLQTTGGRMIFAELADHNG
jgi:uncharacterized protein YacL